jgi:regulator of protease activity HflC (stomatin/prohibitin superfamily)
MIGNKVVVKDGQVGFWFEDGIVVKQLEPGKYVLPRKWPLLPSPDVDVKIVERIEREVVIKDTHRGLWYEDGVLIRVLEAGSYKVPRHYEFGSFRQVRVEVVLVDMRERELTLKGQEILTSDKVAIRTSVVVLFRVVDPQRAVHEVESYEDRLYTDVQLAARRSLASMTLEEILTNRNRLSEDILVEVKESAATYGVSILRADVKDLIFPGDLQEIMNRVLAAERTSQVALLEARTRAETQRLEAEARRTAERLRAESDAETRRLHTAAEVEALRDREEAAAVYTRHPSLLRLQELEVLKEVARSPHARIYLGFDRLTRLFDEGKSET